MLSRIAVGVVVLLSVSPAWAGDGGPQYLIGHDYRDFEFDNNVTPSSIVAGPDGAMWFTDDFNDAIGRMTLDGAVKYFPLDTFSSLYAITLGPDGNLWFAQPGDRAIGRITVGGKPTQFPITGNGFPGDLVAGPDGNLWFTVASQSPNLVGGVSFADSIGRITPNGTVSTFPLDFPVFALTSGPDGALWTSSFNRLGRVTTGGQDQYFEVGTAPGAITTGPDRALWFASSCLLPFAPSGVPSDCAYGIGRLTTDGELTKFPLDDPDTDTLSITRGPEDNLWLTRADGRITRLTVDGRVDDVVIQENGLPTDITVGADGALWYTLPSQYRIARVSSLSYGYLFIANSGPFGMAPGLDGGVWFTDFDGNRVGHIRSDNSLVQYELADEHGPNSIAAAPDGGAFFTNFEAGTIGRITANGEFVEYALPFPDDLPEDIVLGPDGNFWFTIDINSIGRITPEGVVKIFPAPTEDGGPLGITVGGDGNLWFTEMLANKIGRMTTDGEAVDFPIPTADSEPWDIAAAPDGNLYFTESRGGRIARITTSGRVTELGVANPLASPRDIAVGPDRAMWYSIVPLQPEQPLEAVVEPPRPRVAEDPTPTPTLGPARVGRLAPDGRITSFDIQREGINPKYPAGLARSGDGRLYVALSDAASIAVLDIVSAQPTRTPTIELPTETPTQPSGEETATPTETETPAGGATPTPTEPSTCAGDCDGNHVVSISDLVSAVNIVLGNRSVDTCRAADVNGDGEVRINELVIAVGRALQGEC